MLDALRKFFDQHLSEPGEEPQDAADQRARLAAAALMIEVARSDEAITDEERRTVLESVQRKFELDPQRAADLFGLAEVQARDAHDLHQFTSRVNATFDPRRKARLVEELWRAAYADARLSAHEEHLIRRIADLLHVPHSAFISAKLRVQDSSKS